MKNLPTTTPTLENLKSELARAEAEWTRTLMGDALGPIRTARARCEALRAQIVEEERQIAYHNSLREAQGYAYCETHGEFYDTKHWSCCEQCWKRLAEERKEEERQMAYEDAILADWRGDLDCQRFANDAMGGL